jgi:DNA topoisomerase-2
MQTKGTPKVKDCKSDENWTSITFTPDLSKFKMSHLDADIVALMKKRVHDMAGCTPGVKVFLQGERIKVKNFEEYCNMYLNGISVLVFTQKNLNDSDVDLNRSCS